jgi:hypothetical protein
MKNARMNFDDYGTFIQTAGNSNVVWKQNANIRNNLFWRFIWVWTTTHQPGMLFKKHSRDIVHVFIYFQKLNLFQSVRIRVRIGPLHPFVLCKRRLNTAVLRMRPEKPRPCVTAGANTGQNFAALHWQWWRLYISEKFLNGT